MREEYTFKEVIQRIKPEQTYRCTKDVYNVQEISMNDIGSIELKHNLNETAVSSSQKFYLVQKSVDFMEAAKAFMCGKNVRCEYSGFFSGDICEARFVQTDLHNGQMNFRNGGAKLTFYMITSGKWYIED